MGLMLKSDSEAVPENEGNIVDLFDSWCRHYTEACSELAIKSESLKMANDDLTSALQSNSCLQQECKKLQETVSQCQKQLLTLCELEDEIRHVKTQLSDKDQELRAVKYQNQKTLEEVTEKLKEENGILIEQMRSEYEEKLARVENLVKQEQTTRTEVEQKLASLQKDKDKEIARISMEYESKLSQAQRQRAQLIQQQQQVVNQDVMRKKMHHMKETYEKELVSLRAQVEGMNQLKTSASPIDCGDPNNASTDAIDLPGLNPWRKQQQTRRRMGKDFGLALPKR